MDYDYIIESFYVEYKLDQNAIKPLVNEYNITHQHGVLTKIRELFPEFNPITQTVPETISKRLYFVQNRKDRITKYSLKNSMLTDMFRARKDAKIEMGKAYKENRMNDYRRWNSVQNKIKVMINSEYGASGSKTFAHNDPDIAGAITYSARQLIAFVTHQLEYETMYVDDKFIEDNKKSIELLRLCDAIEITDIDVNETFMLNNRSHTLYRFFNDDYTLKTNKVKSVKMPKSKVVYQDTDSNYYYNPYIINYYTNMESGNVRISPEICEQIMTTMKAHNDMYSNFVKYSVDRPPTAVAFESGLIIARYFKAKKKYYGLFWDADKLMSSKLDNPMAYEDNDVLKQHYNEYWKPKVTYLPMEDGYYVKLDAKRLLTPGVNFLDYIKEQCIKPTGIDLARRDQYPVINFFNTNIIREDITLMKYEYPSKWVFTPSKDIRGVIVNTISDFMKTLDLFNRLSMFQFVPIPEDRRFNIQNFSKSAARKEDKQNIVKDIVDRLMKETKNEREKIEELSRKGLTSSIQDEIDKITSESKIHLIPKPMERISYVVTLDDETQFNRAKVTSQTSGLKNRTILVEELIESASKLLPRELYSLGLYKTVSDFAGYKDDPKFWNEISYEDWLNAKSISMLDQKYYTEKLAGVLSLYLVDDEIASSDLIKMRSQISKDILGEFYVSDNKMIGRDLRKIVGPEGNADLMKTIKLFYPDENYTLEFVKANPKQFVEHAKHEMKVWGDMRKQLYKMIENEFTTTDKTPGYYHANEDYMRIYRNNDYDGIRKKIKFAVRQISNNKLIIDSLA